MHRVKLAARILATVVTIEFALALAFGTLDEALLSAFIVAACLLAGFALPRRR